MQLQIEDYNGSDQVIVNHLAVEWQELEDSLNNLDLHFKASDQARKVGSPIFDPVGTNWAIKDSLKAKAGWHANVQIPAQFDFLGNDVDFVKHGLLAEAQFSNYPFLLNTLLRSQLFFNSGTVFDAVPVQCLVVITKTGFLPSSNSTLYFEQAKRQLDTLLGAHQTVAVPVRLVGLFPGQCANCTWTDYTATRYSRTIANRRQRPITITYAANGRCRIVLGP